MLSYPRTFLIFILLSSFILFYKSKILGSFIDRLHNSYKLIVQRTINFQEVGIKLNGQKKMYRVRFLNRSFEWRGQNPTGNRHIQGWKENRLPWVKILCEPQGTFHFWKEKKLMTHTMRSSTTSSSLIGREFLTGRAVDLNAFISSLCHRYV